jgi:hypothetical protein
MIVKFDWIPPSKKNSKTMVCRWRRPMLIPSKSYIEWHQRMSDELEDYSPIVWWGLTFNYTFLVPYNKDWTISKRPFDFSNKIESINDLLVDLDIIEDDNYTIISEQHIYMKHVPFWEEWVILEIKK